MNIKSFYVFFNNLNVFVLTIKAFDVSNQKAKISYIILKALMSVAYW